MADPSIKEVFGSSYNALVQEAGRSGYGCVPLTDASKDDLLAIIGQMCQERELAREALRLAREGYDG